MATAITLNQMENIGNGIAQCDLYGTGGLGASDTGKWVYVGHLANISVEIEGISGDTCSLWGSSKTILLPPADADDYEQIGSNISADAHVAVTIPVLWIKAKITRSAGTAVHARLTGHVRR